MCKVLIIPTIKDSTRENALAFIKEMSSVMSMGNSDGLGYAAVNARGELFGERWLKNKQSFPTLKHVESKDIVQSVFNSVLMYKDQDKSTPDVPAGDPAEGEYNNFGPVDINTMTAITLHTRMATSSRGMQNTHPFVMDDTSLIHNGVIQNVEDFKFTLSTCDSESILISYLENGVNLDPMKTLNALSSSLVGYYVSAVFGRDAEGRRILDLFKAHNSNFYIAWIEELESFVFASSDYNIKNVCETLGFTHREPRQVQDGNFIRLYPNTDMLPDLISFKEGARSASYGGYSGSTSNNSKGSHVYQGGTTSKPVKDEPSNVVQLPASKSKKNLSAKMIEYFKAPTHIRVLTERQVEEELGNYNFRH